MLRRDIENDLLPFCKENSVGVVCYSPMQKGLLTGKFTKAYMQTLAPDDHRRQDPNFTGAAFERNLRIIDALRPIAQRSGKSLSQLAIAWVLRNDDVTSAIVGARRPEQIKETIAAGDWVLSEADVTAIESILRNN
jgi:aryl-alcohol dehydrogenase-like predicted oxidoreductase